LNPCLICNTQIEPFMSFGKMPIANGFLKPEQYPEEHFFELETAFCPHCKMVQLTELVDEQKMFHENYAFFSSTSVRMAEHFQRFAEGVMKDYFDPSDPFVVEIGSNDGIMLQNFAVPGCAIWASSHQPTWPRWHAARASAPISEFFNEDLARRIVASMARPMPSSAPT
jgi:methylation protein EvaC